VYWKAFVSDTRNAVTRSLIQSYADVSLNVVAGAKHLYYLHRLTDIPVWSLRGQSRLISCTPLHDLLTVWEHQVFDAVWRYEYLLADTVFCIWRYFMLSFFFDQSSCIAMAHSVLTVTSFGNESCPKTSHLFVFVSTLVAQFFFSFAISDAFCFSCSIWNVFTIRVHGSHNHNLSLKKQSIPNTSTVASQKHTFLLVFLHNSVEKITTLNKNFGQCMYLRKCWFCDVCRNFFSKLFFANSSVNWTSVKVLLRQGVNLFSLQPSRSTRSSSVVTLSCHLAICSLKITDRSFRYASSPLWNQLPDSFRQPHHSPFLSRLDSPPHPLVNPSFSSSPLSSYITPSLFHSWL